VEQLHESLQRAQEAYHEALEQFHQLQDGSGKAGTGHKILRSHVIPLHGKARQSFEVRPDGTIEVKVRKGDSEVVKLYTNESDLKRREPELYEKYRSVVDEE
jgi:hypothetical protein